MSGQKIGFESPRARTERSRHHCIRLLYPKRNPVGLSVSLRKKDEDHHRKRPARIHPIFGLYTRRPGKEITLKSFFDLRNLSILPLRLNTRFRTPYYRRKGELTASLQSALLFYSCVLFPVAAIRPIRSAHLLSPRNYLIFVFLISLIRNCGETVPR